MTNPTLDLIDLVVADVDASVAFYRAVGIDIPDATVWRTATGAHHVDIELPGGLGLHLDSASLAKAYNEGWSDSNAKAGRVVLGFRQPDRNAVDRLYADLTALGYRGSQPPYDTFWGARYAVALDPDGNPVGLMSPADPAKRTGPPEL